MGWDPIPTYWMSFLFSEGRTERVKKMNKINRRKFLKMLGAGTGVMAAGVVIPGGGLTNGRAFQRREKKLKSPAVWGVSQGGTSHNPSYPIEGNNDPWT